MLQELVYAKLHKVVKNSSLCDWSFLLLGQGPVLHCVVSQQRNGTLENNKTTCYASG